VPFGGELTRATLGFEQIGASGVESAQKYAFDFFVSRPIPRPLWPRLPSSNHYLGGPVRWWGDVRIASYPQQVTTGAAAFATGFVTSAGAVSVGKLVQSAEFTTGLELRLLGSRTPLRGVADNSRARFAVMAFAGGGAVGPFPLSTDAPAVFVVPDTGSQRRAFDTTYPGVTSKYVAFRPQAPDRFLENFATGLRLYTFYTDRGATGEPLQSAPAMVSVSYGWNSLISQERHCWHVAAYYPFALGDRTDPTTLVVYLFGDVWMTGRGAQYSAPAFELLAATDTGGKAIPASDTRVAIVTLPERPRDTYRVGASIDLLKVWQRLAQNGGATR
jgi:hypothetical protein